MKKIIMAFVYSIIIVAGSVYALTLSSDKGPGVTLYYGENAQFELVSPGGIHVYIDVHNPAALSKKGSKQDLLLSTHHHPDHFTYAMTDSFKGRQLDVQVGTLTSGDVKVTSIASGHNSGDKLLDQYGTNYIYLVETAGLRIAHFGDIGQNELTKEQMAVLDKIDIAMSQFENTWSDMDIENKKGFNLMEQLHPQLIIPTHIGDDGVVLLGKEYATLFSSKKSIKISGDSIPKKQSVLFLGVNAEKNGAATKGTKIE